MMGASLGSLLLPAALFFGEPNNDPAAYERGLFCDTVELVKTVVELVDHGADPQKTVREIDARLDRTARPPLHDAP